jgi:predicted PhzF superfamily epimerase YddE/YHI9
MKSGSGHTVLGVYFQHKLNKNVLKAFVASERTGSLIVEVLHNKRVLLKGNAVTVLRGVIVVPP